MKKLPPTKLRKRVTWTLDNDTIKRVKVQSAQDGTSESRAAESLIIKGDNANRYG